MFSMLSINFQEELAEFFYSCKENQIHGIFVMISSELNGNPSHI
jgi:hypothetical protein